MLHYIIFHFQITVKHNVSVVSKYPPKQAFFYTFFLFCGTIKKHCLCVKIYDKAKYL